MERTTHLFVIVAYILATVLFTWPVTPHLTTHVAGDGGDSLQNIWNLWWVERAVTGEEELYFTDYMFHPHGTSLAFHTLSLANTFFLGLPLVLITGDLLLSYNLVLLLSFVLAGYGMFLLSRYLGCGREVAGIAGFAYAFAPYHMAQALGHLNLASVQWLPFFVLFYMKTFEEERWRNPVLAAGFLLLLSLSSWQYLVLAVMLGAVLAVHEMRSGGRLGDRMVYTRFAVFCGSFLAAVLPFAWPLVAESRGGWYGLQSGGFSMISLAHYVIPQRMHPLWGGAVAPVYPPNISDSTVFLGFTVLAVSGAYLLRHRKRVRPWTLIAVVFAVLSLSPNHLHSFLEAVFPLFKGINNMERFGLGVLFSTLVIFGQGLQHYAPRLAGWTGLEKRQVLAAVLVLIAFEFLAVPYYTTPLRGDAAQVDDALPEAVGRVADDPGNVSVINIPPLYNSGALYLQTFHGKKMVGGYVSRIQPGSTRTLMALEQASLQGDVPEVESIVDGLEISYIFRYHHTRFRHTLNLTRLPQQLPTTVMYNSTRLSVYRIEN